MTALRLFRIGYDTMMIADQLGTSEADVELQLHKERTAEHAKMMHGMWPAMNGMRLDALRSEGLLP